ncbi:hypothetical protein BWZ20_04310 [Winogradskyella sp. J14-2]|uniref:energy transducer TonB n=1 Tax=Winogradskyella sp. J14-2 TaxID=1936080 RepID=UPI000972CC01|nr:energy transducer TonB [Winogradskyella sp. J14-2]APY07566.1 hypothetical protein BWZ20_04310 [Winogradskyella sp. J14-2]
MKLKLLFICFLFPVIITQAQTTEDTKLMGEWEAVKVIIANADEIPQKDAIKFLEDAFLGSKFNFKGNQVFRITFGSEADERIKELFKLDKTNWIIENELIKIGSKNNGFNLMNIRYREQDDKVFFALPMLALEMKKLRDDKPSEAEWIESEEDNIPTVQPVDYSKSEIVTKDIDETSVLEFQDAENPPLAPECKENWDSEKKRDCTNKYINRHLMRKFNVDLASKIQESGKIKILITFIIDTEGKAINIKATGGPEILNKHAIEIVGLLPTLTPATKDDKPVNVSYKLPFTFFIAN